MNIKEEYSKFFDNFLFNMGAIKDILDKGVNNTEHDFLDDEIHKDIVTNIQNKFKDKDPQDVIFDNLDTFEDLIKTIGLFDKYNGKVVFMGHAEYKKDKEKVKSYKNEGKRVCISSVVYIELDMNKKNKMKLNIGYNMAYVYMHTVFDTFMIDTIKIIMLACPSSLKSGSTMSYEEILKCNDYSSIVNKIIDRELEILGRGSYEDKLDYLTKRGIKLDIDEHKWNDNVIFFCEIRNVIIHNQGIINRNTYDKLKKTKYEEGTKKIIGSKVEITREYLEEQYDQIIEVSESFYRTVCNKFSNISASDSEKASDIS